MQQKYVPPELELAGEAAEVVLGGGGGGSDMFGEYLDGEGEFASDTDVEGQ